MVAYRFRCQSDSYDSLEPAYSCPVGSAVDTAYEGTNPAWTAHLTDAAPLYAKLDAVSGIVLNDTGGWSVFLHAVSRCADLTLTFLTKAHLVRPLL